MCFPGLHESLKKLNSRKELVAGSLICGQVGSISSDLDGGRCSWLLLQNCMFTAGKRWSDLLRSKEPSLLMVV